MELIREESQCFRYHLCAIHPSQLRKLPDCSWQVLSISLSLSSWEGLEALWAERGKLNYSLWSDKVSLSPRSQMKPFSPNWKHLKDLSLFSCSERLWRPKVPSAVEGEIVFGLFVLFNSAASCSWEFLPLFQLWSCDLSGSVSSHAACAASSSMPLQQDELGSALELGNWVNNNLMSPPSFGMPALPHLCSGLASTFLCH